MENKTLLIPLLILLFVLEIFYFKLATKYKILDIPNKRSLHAKAVIRGGGIIVVLAAILFFFWSNYQYPLFFIGLLLIATISFLDDIYTLPNKIRIAIQFISVSLLVSELDLNGLSIFLLLCLIILLLGIINAYNFMDGINGITGSYSFICIGTLLFLNTYKVGFINPDLFYFLLCSLVVFIFFNFRKNAKCFAGDVGSISLGFIICFLIGKLIQNTGEFKYLLLLSVYGTDSVLTIIQRIWKKENIFKAHKTHLYQLLVDKTNLSHLMVSSLYMITQLFINFIIIFMVGKNQYMLSASLILVFCTFYIFLKRNILKNEKPFNKIA